MRSDDITAWFGSVAPIGERPVDQAVVQLRDADDPVLADELAAGAVDEASGTFGAGALLRGMFNRFMRTTHVCAFLPATGSDVLVPIAEATPAPELREQPLKLTLDGLHVAKYPGRGTHTVLFDFAVQSHAREAVSPVFHYNARFEAKDGETVPVRNFPLFHGLPAGRDGVTFGFQTVNVASSFDQGLLDFLRRDEFKRGLSVLSTATPLLGQLSEMAASLTGWLAGQSANVKVQEFRQGLDFESARLGGALAEGYYVIAQIPVENEREWRWSDWKIDTTLVRLVRRDDPATHLDFNHLMFGLHRLDVLP